MSALELPLVALVLVPAVMAVVELGNMAQQQIELQQALRAGGQYALKHGFNNADSIQTAVQQALPSNWTNITVGTQTVSCLCYSTNTSYNSDCPINCPIPETSITLTASTPYSGLFVNTTIGAAYVVQQ